MNLANPRLTCIITQWAKIFVKLLILRRWEISTWIQAKDPTFRLIGNIWSRISSLLIRCLNIIFEPVYPYMFFAAPRSCLVAGVKPNRLLVAGHRSYQPRTISLPHSFAQYLPRWASRCKESQVCVQTRLHRLSFRLPVPYFLLSCSFSLFLSFLVAVVGAGVTRNPRRTPSIFCSLLYAKRWKGFRPLFSSLSIF